MPVVSPSRFEFDSITGASSFDYDLDFGKLITGFKDRSLLQLAAPLTKAWLENLQGCLTEFRPEQILIPPSSKFNNRKRGYNPCELLVKKTLILTGKNLTVPTAELKLTRETKDQTNLNRSERFGNLAGAFYYNQAKPARVLLVDDVITTSSTMTEMIRAVRVAGSEVVGICVLARRI